MTATFERSQDALFRRAAVSDALDQAVVDAARARGFTLMQFETDTGQLVWAWRHHDDPAPQFLTRRVALSWMADWLERGARHGL